MLLHRTLTVTAALLASIVSLLASLGSRQMSPFTWGNSSPSSGSSTADFSHGRPESSFKPIAPRWKINLCYAHAALADIAGVASPAAGAEEVDQMVVDIFSALHLSPADLVSAKSVSAVAVEAWRAAVSEAMELPVCLQEDGGDDPDDCRSYKNALALAARAIQDRDIRDLWDSELTRIIRDYEDKSKKGWRGSGSGIRGDQGDEERKLIVGKSMKAALDALCAGL